MNSRLYTSVSNTSDDSDVFFYFDRTENEGIFLETGGYERYGVRLNADFKVNEWLKLSASHNYVRTNNETSAIIRAFFCPINNEVYLTKIIVENKDYFIK